MGTRRDPVNGLIVLDKRMIDDTNLAANTGAATTSDYSQSTPRPGRVTLEDGQSLVPVISNAQGVQVDLRVQRAGLAGDCALAYSVDGGTTKRGWHGPHFCGYSTVDYQTTGAGNEPNSSVVIPSTQTIMCAYGTRSGGTPIRVRTYDGTSWSSAVDVSDNDAYALGLWVYPDESTIVCARIASNGKLSTFFSRDTGATWARLASQADIGITTSTTSHVSCGWVGQDMLLITDAGEQYASSDGGVSWSSVTTDSNIDSGQVTSAADGTALVVYVDGSDGDVKYVRLASAYDPIVASAGTVIVAGTYTGLAAAVDYDGEFHVYCRATGSVIGEWHTSTDGGVTWVDHGQVWYSANSQQRANQSTMVARNGTMMIIGPFNVTGNTNDDSIVILRYSRFSDLEWDGIPDACWIGLNEPTYEGWATTGTTGTIGSPGVMTISTSAATGYYTYTTASGASFTTAAHFLMKCTSGGSLTTSDVAARLLSCDAGADSYGIIAAFTTTGFAVVDRFASTQVTTVSVDCTTNIEIFMGFSAQATPFLYYKRATDYDWTEVDLSGYGSFTSSGAGTANWTFDLGNIASSTSTGVWNWVSLYDDVGTLSSGNGLEGKVFNALPYPLPGTENADSKPSMLSIRGGIGYTGETYTIPPEYDYLATSALPGISPSPYVGWQSEDTTEQIICFNLGNRSFLGGAWALLLQQVNFKTAYLEYYDGSNWQTAGTYNGSTGFASLTYDRVGDNIGPAAGSASGGRIVQGSEFADGGWVDLGSSKYRYISSNGTGRWEIPSSTTTALATFTLSGVDGTEPSTGTCTIVADGGLLVVYPTTAQIRQYWRVRIPTQNCPDSYFKAGVIAIGRVMPFGQQFGWGWQNQDEARYDAFFDRAGTQYRTQLGHPNRKWTFDFSGGIASYNLRSVGDSDYIGISGGLRLETFGGSHIQLRSLLEETNGFTIPVVGVNTLPTSTTTITDKTLYLYGYLSGSIAVTHANGLYGTDELIRIETLTIEGITG